MLRKLLFPFVMLLILVPASTLAQDLETGSVSGTVDNGTEGGGDVAGLEVILQRFVGMDPVEEYTTTVADDGSYEFTDLPISEGEAFLATVHYKEVDFRSGMILLTQETHSERDITVYEPTADLSVLSFVSRGVVIAGADQENGMIDVLEIIALENDSDHVFVGDESGQVLRIAVPENAADIAPQAGFNFGQLMVDGNVLVSTGSVIPGSHNPMISYQIPYSGTSGTLAVGTTMETRTLRVLVESGTYDISSQVLTPAGQQMVGSVEYDVLAVDSPVVGTTLNVRISGLPRENWNLPVDVSTFLASLAAGLGLVIGAVLIYQVVQRRGSVPAVSGQNGREIASPDEPDELEVQRRELAAELNRIEADYEHGDLDEGAYNRERDQILEELRQLSLRLRGLED